MWIQSATDSYTWEQTVQVGTVCNTRACMPRHVCTVAACKLFLRVGNFQLNEDRLLLDGQW